MPAIQTIPVIMDDQDIYDQAARRMRLEYSEQLERYRRALIRIANSQPRESWPDWIIDDFKDIARNALLAPLHK